MNEGRTVFSQVLDFVPRHTFRRRVQRYRGDYGVRGFTCWQQFLAMLFAQLTYRESVRDIEACLGAAPERLYHMGFTGPVSRSTLADANECRDWRIYADVAQVLIAEARKLYADEPLDVELDRTVYALDSSTVDLTLSCSPGPASEKPRPPSSCTPCSTCGATSRSSSGSPMAEPTMFASSAS
jgi:hypothetical protein